MLGIFVFAKFDLIMLSNIYDIVCILYIKGGDYYSFAKEGCFKLYIRLNMTFSNC
jgi:hypothetical protein